MDLQLWFVDVVVCAQLFSHTDTLHWIVRHHILSCTGSPQFVTVCFAMFHSSCKVFQKCVTINIGCDVKEQHSKGR